MSYLDTLLNDQVLWDAISQYTVGQARRGSGKFPLKLNCPVCVSRGTSADTRYRCGVARSPEGIGIFCFNCDFRARWVVGQPLSRNMKSFLRYIHVPEREIKGISLRLFQLARMKETVKETQPDYAAAPRFAPISLPPGSQTLETWVDAGCEDANFLAVATYLLGRGDVVARATGYYWTPLAPFNRRLIIPCWHNNEIVGWTGRAIDNDAKPKYYNQTPTDFLFNTDFLSHPYRKYIFIVEGIFDALVIDGVAAMRSRLTAQQVRWIKQSDKIPIVVPDRDEAGQRLATEAITHKWGVAFTDYARKKWWQSGIKDADEAVRIHGKLFTIQSIIATADFNPTGIEQKISYLYRN